MALKANQTDVDAEMDLKANQTDVDTAMDAKVNTTDFNTATCIFHKAMKIISLMKYAPEN